MIISDRVKNLLNRVLPLFEQITFGDIIQRMQQDIDAGGGGGLPVASQAEAEAGVVNDKTMTPLRVLQSITANAPGGGSAYPEPVTPIAVNTVLTPAEQGIVLATASGVTLTLPATAMDGTTYSILPITGSIQIDTNGAVVSDLGAGVLTIDGNPINLVAVNITPGPGLVWWLKRNDILPRVYSMAAVYPMCAIVEDSGDFYMSRTSANTGNPLTDAANWHKLTSLAGHAIEDEGIAITQRSAMNFTGAGVSVSDAGGKTVVTIPGGAALPVYVATGSLSGDITMI